MEITSKKLVVIFICLAFLLPGITVSAEKFDFSDGGQSEFEIEADQEMLAIGEVPNLDFLPSVIDEKWGRVDVDAYQMTNDKGIFACGDSANGPIGTVVDAIATGKRAAIAIDAFLNNAEAEYQHYGKVVTFNEINLDYFKKEKRVSQNKNNQAEVLSNFNEVHLGISENDALYEAERCFSCGICTYCDTCLIYCPDVAITKATDGKGYIIDYEFCKGCGLCVHECPRNAMTFEEELKWRIV